MRFSPEDSTRITATPVDVSGMIWTEEVSRPERLMSWIIVGPKASAPTAPIIFILMLGSGEVVSEVGFVVERRAQATALWEEVSDGPMAEGELNDGLERWIGAALVCSFSSPPG